MAYLLRSRRHGRQRSGSWCSGRSATGRQKPGQTSAKPVLSPLQEAVSPGSPTPARQQASAWQSSWCCLGWLR